MTSIISSNHNVAKLGINLHIINFCHDYFILCNTGISAYKGVLPVKTDRVSSGISRMESVALVKYPPMFVGIPFLTVFSDRENLGRSVPVFAQCVNYHLILSVFIDWSAECHMLLSL